MKKLPENLFNKYKEDPYKYDYEVRNFCGIKDNKYYTVSMWPEHLAGRVYVNEHLVRIVKDKKISKSDIS